MNRVHFGDCRLLLRRLAAQGLKAQCAVTSPPYFGLRDYGTAQWVGGDQACGHRAQEIRRGLGLAESPANTRGGAKKVAEVGWIQFRGICGKCGAQREDAQIGLEPLHDCLAWAHGVATAAPRAAFETCGQCYVCGMVDVFRALREVLADDGVAFLNLGDSYVASRGGASSTSNGGLKPKDLCMIPARVALALQADGWYLRSDIIWSKPNPLPESVEDRPTKSHEYVWLLAKSERYFFDHEAIKEPAAESSLAHARQAGFSEQTGGPKDYGTTGVNANRSSRKTVENFAKSVRKYSFARETDKGAALGQKPQHRGDREDVAYVGAMRNKRSVWTVATRPYSGAHFATYPPALITPMILAGTSERGRCPQCLARWVRVVEKGEPLADWRKASGADASGSYVEKGGGKDFDGTGAQNARDAKASILAGMVERTTVGWRASCECGLDPVPDVVIDPFMGSGTTAQEAQRLGRNWVGTELNPANEALQRERTRQIGLAV